MLNLARLTGWKGQRVLIEAAALPPLAGREDIVFVLAGDAQGRDDYRRELERLDRGARAERPGAESSAIATTRRRRLRIADVAVIASTEPEAFGRTAVEAAAMGVPVVATALGATAETVLAPPAVDRGGANRLARPAGERPRRLPRRSARRSPFRPTNARALAERARRHAESFATAAMQQATLALYDRLLSRAGDDAGFSKR